MRRRQNVKQIVVVYLSCALRPSDTHKKCNGHRARAPASQRSQFNSAAAHFMLIRNIRYITHFTRLITILNLDSTVLPYYFHRTRPRLAATSREKERERYRTQVPHVRQDISPIPFDASRERTCVIQSRGNYNMAKSTRAIQSKNKNRKKEK